MRDVARYILLAVIAISSPTALAAQGLDPRDQVTLNEELRQREQAARDRAAGSTARGAQPQDTGIAPPEPLAPSPGGPCFVIESIRLSGKLPIGEQPTAHLELIGKCATAEVIGKALNQINTHYQNAGYITTRAYVPEQDINDGALDITIVPGTVDGFIYADGMGADDRLLSAFPMRKHHLLNLRDLEQGLENLNAPRSAGATFQLTPGIEAGGSRVQVDVQDSDPHHFDANLTNADTGGGADTTLGLNFGLDNSLGINDQLTIGLTTAPFEDRRQAYTDSFNLGWKIPAGNWSLDVSAGASRYFFVLPGINQTYDVTGRSHNFALDASRLLMRNQSAKAYVYSGVKLTRSRTFIDGFEIATQRRRLTIGSLGLRGEKSFKVGKLNWNVGARFGLRAFGAELHPLSIVNREFQLAKLSVSYERPVGQNGASYKAELVGQHSKDVLPGTEQFSIGSWSTVRGYSSDTMYGDSGLYWRNTYEWDALKQSGLKVRMHVGLDVGYVTPSALRNWSQNYLVGASLGAEIKIRDKTTLTLKAAQALSRPTSNPPNALPAFEGKETVGFIGLKVEF